MIVQPKGKFCQKIKLRLSEHGKKGRAAKEISISRIALWNFLKGNAVRLSTLDAIVKKFEGENANVEDYIKPL